MADKFYTTKFTVEISIDHQFAPSDIFPAVKGLLRVPAVNHIKLIGAESNFQLHREPSETFEPVLISNAN